MNDKTYTGADVATAYRRGHAHGLRAAVSALYPPETQLPVGVEWLWDPSEARWVQARRVVRGQP